VSGDPRACPEHGPPAEPDHRFCEACGRNLATGESAAVALAPPRPPADSALPESVRWLSSRAAGQACAGCGATAAAGSGYCDHCGRRYCAGQDRAELDLGGVAGVTDRARRRHNEDALAIGRLGDSIAAVVCDGVSTSTRADAAAQAAAQAGLTTLLAALHDGQEPDEAVVLGTRAAARAARDAAEPHDGSAPPSCTYVAAVVTPGSVTVAWIGDSRAYWLAAPPAGSALLTVDDSPAGWLAAGRPVPPSTGVDPHSRALIRWLGADSTDAEPQLAMLRPPGAGRLVLCTDGLSHYLPEPTDMAAAVAGMPPAPADVARGLTRLALAAGGHDNVAVAVLPYPPTPDGGHVA
jgi:PPM family protein phosphatase